MGLLENLPKFSTILRQYCYSVKTYMKKQVNIFWFRRDLRLSDNAGLYHALKSRLPVIPVFIFDKNILDKLDDKKDARVAFIHEVIMALQEQLKDIGASLKVFYGFPEAVFAALVSEYAVEKVFTNHDYEPYAVERDQAIGTLLNDSGITFHTYKDQVIFEKDEVMKDDGTPYVVFTPYSKKWKSLLTAFLLKPYPTKKYFKHFLLHESSSIPTLEAMGFQPLDHTFPSREPAEKTIRKYKEQRNFPGIAGTSKMSIHLRFGTISIRALAKQALSLSETYLNELIWREFYQMILWHFPKVGKGHAFKKEYEYIKWRNNEKEFGRWREGKTGYPLVDAGMRELNTTGFMHNRVRMVVASFLTKHLLIDWRWGEAYFAEKLIDFELASNNGGWQWAAGSGCDAAPYFRIFNPYLQTKRFDPDFTYIRKWVPEFEEFGYPPPIVVHEFARKRCLEVYSAALKEKL